MSSFFRSFSLLSILLVMSVCAFSQVRQTRNCATNQYYQKQLLNNPSLQQRMDAIERHIQQYIKNPTKQKNRNAVITIPVVFHVVYNNSTQNISDAQLQSQIDVLNEDFAALNNDISTVPSAFQSVIGTSQIQFCLASIDPNGNPTNGIVRVQTSTSSFGTNNAIKFSSQGGSDAWPTSDYMNFWVGNLTGGLLGYAQFPGGNASTDGVVCLYTSIGRPPFNSFGGSFNLGRTATHEVGHWLNLRHIWGDSNCGNDFVADTPTQQTSNGGCPSFPHVTCSNGPNGDMFMNYMDYVNDACMVMFSAGQVVRMEATFGVGGPRESLLSSNGCGSLAPCTSPPVAGIVTASSTSVCPGTSVSFTLSGNSGGTGETYQWQQSSNNSTWSNISGATGLSTVINVSSNLYVRCNVTCGGSTVPTSSILVSAIGGINSFPFTENFDGVTSPAFPCGWTTQDVNSDGFEIFNGNFDARSASNCVTYKWNTNSVTAANDWIFTPPIQMTAGNNYEITFWYRARSATYPEALEINWGISPNAASMTGGTLFSDNNITTTTYVQGTSNLVSPTTSGTYYFGIHVNSAADKYDLYIDDVTINEVAPCGAPPVGGTITGPSNFEAGPGGGTYNLNGYSGNIQWQFSVIPGGPFSDFPGATSSSVDLISSSPGTYYVRAVLSKPGCAEAYSNVFTFVVESRTGDNFNKPIVVSTPNYTYTDSTTAAAGFTNANSAQTNAQQSADVYFSLITGACTDWLNINTCASSFDTYIHLLDANGNVIVSNDDNGPFCTGAGVPGSISSVVLPNTLYYVVVEGWNTETGIFTVDIDEADVDKIAITTAIQNITCNNLNNGELEIVINGGSAPYNINWNTSPPQSSSFINNLSAGNYTALVTDNEGCTASSTSNITNPTALFYSAIITDPSTPTSTDGEIDLTIQGAVPPYSFIWSNGATTEDNTNLPEGVHQCIIQDANGCSELYLVNLIGGISANNSSSKFIAGSDKLKFYPNPTSNNISVSISSDIYTKSEILIYDINMKVVLQKEIYLNKGLNHFDLNVQSLNAGVYVIGGNFNRVNAFQKLIIE